MSRKKNTTSSYRPESGKTKADRMSQESLVLRGCAEHNLKSVDLDIPHDILVSLTGVSGSGKSSLAFETIYAEGQRRYLETFSPYVRQFFERFNPAKVDSIEHLRPTLAIQQKTRVRSSRSTVGTLTHLNDLLKVLWANISDPTCDTCGISLEHWQPGLLAEHVQNKFLIKDRSELIIGAPVSFDKQWKSTVERLQILGIERYFEVDSELLINSEDLLLRKKVPTGSFMVVISRVRGVADRQELSDAIAQSFKFGDHRCCIVERIPNKRGLGSGGATRKHVVHIFTEVPQCPTPKAKALVKKYAVPKPALFTFNHPYGACPACNGFGAELVIDFAKCLPDQSLSLEQGAIACWSTAGTEWERNQLFSFCQKKKISITKPWRELPDDHRQLVLYGKEKGFWGLQSWFDWLESKKYKMHVRVLLSKYKKQVTCSVCQGKRLQPDALAYKCGGLSLPDLWSMTVDQLSPWLINQRNLLVEAGKLSRPIRELFNEIIIRLRYLDDLGLAYLTLERSARTLSGGETQRVNLANALGGSLVSTHFILDEPSVGLHRKDSKQLLKSIRGLQERGNSVLMVEHDHFLLHSADQIIELGPEAGEKGGEVVYFGSAAAHPGPGKLLIDVGEGNRRSGSIRAASSAKKSDFIEVVGASANNIVDLSLKIPSRSLVCFTGVSGSGKSTLMHSIIYEDFIGQSPTSVFPAFLRKCAVVDQTPLVKSPRATIATYTKVWDTMRNLFADSDDAVARKIKPTHFSFNVPGGRCEACKGSGAVLEEMQFLGDVLIPCDVCGGQRYKPQILEVNFRGKTVFSWLQTTVNEAVNTLGDIRQVVQKLRYLQEVGLGHLTLGHSLADLSGGEAQRLKLVSVLEGREAEESLLLFDEPTLGLEIRDVLKLIQLLHKLRDQGCSIICIAHHCALMMSSDWIVDLGPAGGRDGGKIVDQGPPLDIERRAIGYTGVAMQEYRKLTVSGNAGSIPDAQRRSNRTQKAECVSLEKRRLAERKFLSIKGAREHNLKNVSVDLPMGVMVGLVGVSGSGKSTVAKDIIHAESQHQFLSCLSPYARQFVNTLSRPDIDSISGLQPTIFVGQHQVQPSTLSTVGTISEINHYLRLLFAKIGQQFCTDHPDVTVGGGSPLAVSDRLSEIRGTKIVRLLAPIIRKKKGAHREVFLRAIDLGIDEVRCDGVFGAPSKFIDDLDKRVVHTIEYVVLKGHPQRLNKDLLTEAAAWGISLGEGEIIIDINNGESSELFSVHRSCPKCNKGYPKLDPEDFSFSSRRGRCSGCSGTGVGKNGKECSRCQGTRLHAIARHVKINGSIISDLCLMHPGRLISFLESLKGESSRNKLIQTLIVGATARLRTLESLGLEYLSLSREGPTLSGGELQRLRLAAALASPLAGMMYIFDEPSIGLHPFDAEKVLGELHRLCKAGNSIVMIEHDADCIRSCDHIVEIGPGGGKDGGEVVFNGSAEKFLKSASTVTSRSIATLDNLSPYVVGQAMSSGLLRIVDGSCNNISELSVSVPLGAMTTVVGLSGAGKTSLVQGVIVNLLTEGKCKEGKDGKFSFEGACGRLISDRPISKVVCVDQKPIGLNSRSTPVSFLGIWDPIRQIFAQSIQAKSLGWNAGYFSYNTGNGRCSECRGQGELQLEMSFLPNARVECSTCRGTRYQDDVGEVKYLGKSIIDILAMTFDEARKFFVNHRKILPILSKVCELGLGYLTLGQPAPSLSGGESQRLKLVLELSRRNIEGALFVFDEPTVGLHLSDVSKLLGALRDLVSNGATVLIVEHEVQVVMASDYVIEMGPGAGENGGKVVFSGELNDLYSSTSHWGALVGSKVRGKHHRMGLNSR